MLLSNNSLCIEHFSMVVLKDSISLKSFTTKRFCFGSNLEKFVCLHDFDGQLHDTDVDMVFFFKVWQSTCICISVDSKQSP